MRTITITDKDGARRMRARWAALAAVALALAGCGSEPTVAETTLFEDVLAGCKDMGGASYLGASVEDDGRTMIIDGRGEGGPSGVEVEAIGCLLAGLDMPQRVASLMDSTRALDGRQTDSWDDVIASWTYHPDNGLDIVLSLDD